MSCCCSIWKCRFFNKPPYKKYHNIFYLYNTFPKFCFIWYKVIKLMASNNGSYKNTETSRKVMVVADPTRESAGALQYALCHAVMEQDELILLHVLENPNSWRNTLSTFLKMPSLGTSTTASMIDFGGGGGGGGGGDQGEGVVDFLEEMKKACMVSQPKLKVRVLKVEMDNGKDRANTILSHIINQGVHVVVIGQKRTLSSTLLG